MAMQPADLIAYEAFKRLHAQRKTKGEIRHVLKSLMKANVVNECYFGAATLGRMKNQIEWTPCGRRSTDNYPFKLKGSVNLAMTRESEFEKFGRCCRETSLGFPQGIREREERYQSKRTKLKNNKVR